MTLGTHAVAGALIGAIASENIAFVVSAAFLSHFLLDTIPHWDYKLGSIENQGVVINNDMNTHSRTFLVDLVKIGFDFWIGIGLVIIAYYQFPMQVFLGALVGGLMGLIPDPLQFVYWKTRWKWMLPLQKFHMWMHSENRLKGHPILGILSQTAIMAVSLMAVRLL
ncbi:MAG: hypothetical protein M3Q63_01680 [bacterium]|nr:hypothetical protein [bacterium]